MRRDFYQAISDELNNLKINGTYKFFKHNTNAMDNKINIEDYGEAIVLCSNNYLGLANKKEIIEAAHIALEKYGAGAGSVRFIAGTYDIHRELEEKLASFLNMEASITYSSCWAANTAAIPALLSNGDTVISDELNHASIIDGCRAVSRGVNRAVYKHSDMQDLEEKLIQSNESGAILVVTDGVFSMEGDIAKLPEIISLCRKYNAILMLDDSHATGVIGKTGKGTMEYFNVNDGVDIISGTFGKALGGAGGGFIAASKDICSILAQRSRPHLFSNGLPPVLCSIALTAIEYLESNPAIVKSLKEKTLYMRKKLKESGYAPLEGDSAIVPIIVGDTAKAIAIAQEMLKEGIYATGFGFPVVPEGSARIRLQISDALSYEDLDEALSVMKKLKREFAGI